MIKKFLIGNKSISEVEEDEENGAMLPYLRATFSCGLLHRIIRMIEPLSPFLYAYKSSLLSLQASGNL